MTEASHRHAKISPARRVAYRILMQVDRGRTFAVDLLQSAEVSELREVDRRLATELVMGVLRWRGELDFEIERLSGKPLSYFDPELRVILRLGVYQIRFLERIPKSAAVNEGVELAKIVRKRSAAGLVNAVLRKCERSARSLRPAATPGEATSSPQPERSERARRAVPRWLLERWDRNFGREAATSLACSSVRTPRTTLRVDEAARDAVQQELAQAGVQTRVGAYVSTTLVVESADVRLSQPWRQQRITFQDEASQLVALLVAPQPGEGVLDLCAAPGIKTAQLLGALGRGTLIATDRSASRLREMALLLPKRMPGGPRVELVRLDAIRALPFAAPFDRVMLDAPCSGTGTLARHPEIKWRLAPGDLVRLAEAQAAMLRNALDMLRPGGRLVYATCSLEPEENEQVVEKLLAERSDARLVGREDLVREFPRFSPLFDARGYLRTRPDLHQTDGFFAAVLTKSR